MKDGCDRVFERVFQSWIGQRLHGLSGVGIVLGDLWVVLKLEWSPRTPPVESCWDRSSYHQPHLRLFLFLSLCSNPISIFPFFLDSTAASFIPISVFPFFLTSAAASLSVSAAYVFPVFLLSSVLWVMNISLSCCNMIAWQRASLCNAEHFFSVINKIAVF